MAFGPVDPDFDLVALEEQVLERWNDRDVIAETRRLRKDAEPWVFYEGPPTANGRPGIHHVEPRTFKDVYPRFKTMTGHRVRRTPTRVPIRRDRLRRGGSDLPAALIVALGRAGQVCTPAGEPDAHPLAALPNRVTGEEIARELDAITREMQDRLLGLAATARLRERLAELFAVLEPRALSGRIAMGNSIQVDQRDRTGAGSEAVYFKFQPAGPLLSNRRHPPD